MSQNHALAQTRSRERSTNHSDVTGAIVWTRDLPTFPPMLRVVHRTAGRLGQVNTMDESIIELAQRVHELVVLRSSLSETEFQQEFSLSSEDFNAVAVWLLSAGDVDLDTKNGETVLTIRR